MAGERKRLIELALESLENKKKQIDDEIAELRAELKATGARASRAGKLRARAAAATATKAEAKAAPKKRRLRFSAEERKRRSERMTAYWEDWRNKKKKASK